ncbi:hypothetical protein DL93DRAFT_2085645 [Clavulina sp. PMI_390]|nr:hypothetical protein DL93DRAFT_2085645 [Clavulina sp. PMI_390]
MLNAKPPRSATRLLKQLRNTTTTLLARLLLRPRRLKPSLTRPRRRQTSRPPMPSHRGGAGLDGGARRKRRLRRMRKVRLPSGRRQERKSGSKLRKARTRSECVRVDGPRSCARRPSDTPRTRYHSCVLYDIVYSCIVLSQPSYESSLAVSSSSTSMYYYVIGPYKFPPAKKHSLW